MSSFKANISEKFRRVIPPLQTQGNALHRTFLRFIPLPFNFATAITLIQLTRTEAFRNILNWLYLTWKLRKLIPIHREREIECNV